MDTLSNFFIINDHDGLLKHFYYKLQQRFGVYSIIRLQIHALVYTKLNR